MDYSFYNPLFVWLVVQRQFAPEQRRLEPQSKCLEQDVYRKGKSRQRCLDYQRRKLKFLNKHKLIRNTKQLILRRYKGSLMQSSQGVIVAEKAGTKLLEEFVNIISGATSRESN